MRWLIQRLRAAAARKKEETIEQLQSDIANYEALKQRRDSQEISQADFSATIRRGGFANEEDFEATSEPPHTPSSTLDSSAQRPWD